MVRPWQVSFLYHGNRSKTDQITVVQTTNPSYIGVTGIVIQETMSMFKIITKENKLKRMNADTNMPEHIHSH